MLVALVLAVAQTLGQSVRAAKLFLKVVEVGFKFARANELLVYKTGNKVPKMRHCHVRWLGCL